MHPDVMIDAEEDDTARLTVAMDDERHRFEGWVEEEGEHRRALVEYEETMDYRGQTKVASPADEVWEALVTDEAFMEWMASVEADTFRRYA